MNVTELKNAFRECAYTLGVEDKEERFCYVNDLLNDVGFTLTTMWYYKDRLYLSVKPISEKRSQFVISFDSKKRSHLSFNLDEPLTGVKRKVFAEQLLQVTRALEKVDAYLAKTEPPVVDVCIDEYKGEMYEPDEEDDPYYM